MSTQLLHSTDNLPSGQLRKNAQSGARVSVILVCGLTFSDVPAFSAYVGLYRGYRGLPTWEMGRSPDRVYFGPILASVAVFRDLVRN